MRNNSKPKKLGKKSRYFIALICVIVFAVSTTLFIRNNVKKYCQNYAQAIVNTNVSDCLFISTSEVLTQNDRYSKYEDFVQITKDSEDKVSFIRINMLLVNLLMVDLTNTCQENINKLCNEFKVKMPFGVLFGSVLFADEGHSLGADIVPIGNISCALDSQFTKAGINQTRHSLFFNINAKVELTLPLYVDTQNVSIKVLVFETIIAGKVPDVYMEGVEGNAMDLVPY